MAAKTHPEEQNEAWAHRLLAALAGGDRRRKDPGDRTGALGEQLPSTAKTAGAAASLIATPSAGDENSTTSTVALTRMPQQSSHDHSGQIYRMPYTALDAVPSGVHNTWSFHVSHNGSANNQDLKVRIARFRRNQVDLRQWKASGAYVLLWRRPDAPLRVYVGRSSDLASRISTHLSSADKDFDEVVLFSAAGTESKPKPTAQDQYRELLGFDEAEIACLESFLLQMFAAVGSVEIANLMIPRGDYIRMSRRGTLAEVALAVLLFISRSGHRLHVPMNHKAKMRVGGPCPFSHKEKAQLQLVFGEDGPVLCCSQVDHRWPSLAINDLWECYLLYGLTREGRRLVARRERARKRGTLATPPAAVVARRNAQRNDADLGEPTE